MPVTRPPVQIRTCSITAYGSCLGCWRQIVCPDRDG